MLLTKTIDVKWNNSNKKRLEGFGYAYTKNGDIINIKIEHLSKYSNLEVEVMCDYCGKIIKKSYQNYTTQRKNIDKDACYECRYEKEKDILKERQSNNQIEKGQRRYYLFKENRLQEVDNYIKKYGTLDGLTHNKEGVKLCNNLANHGDNIYKLAVELGYDLPSITSKKPSWYYEDFNTLKDDIQKIIDKYGSFPSSNQIMRELNISNRPIEYHGGINEIRCSMGWNDDKYLDNNGFYNSSFYETIVANYLIAQGLGKKYKREQYPFSKEEGNYRSDFTFYLENNNVVHCEVWGLSNGNGEIGDNYNDARQIKEVLYKKYSIELISIEPDIFSKSYKDIDKYLYNKFKNYLDLKIKTVSQENLIPSSMMTDEELLHEIMKYSDDEDYLPTTIQLKGVITTYYNEIMKRYETYQDFANKFNKKVEFTSNGFWTQEKIFEKFDYMILKYGKILNREDCKKDTKLKKFSYIVQSNKYGGFLNNRLNYLQNLRENSKEIPEDEIEFLYDVSRGNSKNYSRYIDQEKRNKAENILMYLKENGLLDEKYCNFTRKDYGQEDHLLNLVFDVFMYMIHKYGKILSENEFRKLRNTDEKLNEINVYKRIQRSGKYNLKEVKEMFDNYLSENQQSA